ncbi:MAG: bifunctional methionine sulfoxide reductase B/A protein [Burkholderiales bacterium]|nr:bifunctional methionine sulfoxide reductase B/A protein [Burkholderiales bacterium]
MNKTNSLLPITKRIMFEGQTEYPNTAEEPELTKGTYLCRNCGLALYRAQSKFISGCGWPSFDNQIQDKVIKKETLKPNVYEILCSRCNGHLGHIFYGENFTPLNVRHCVNSLALDYITNDQVLDTQEAIVAAGCFWGVEYYFQQLKGVLSTEVGYCGGKTQYPSYKDVCNGNTGHAEGVRVLFDPNVICYEEIIKYYFEIHDFSQQDGQGYDIGEQYLSIIFYHNPQQQDIANKVIQLLKDKNYSVATKVVPAQIFWPAEKYHQNYYAGQRTMPDCHIWNKRF